MRKRVAFATFLEKNETCANLEIVEEKRCEVEGDGKCRESRKFSNSIASLARTLFVLCTHLLCFTNERDCGMNRIVE